MDINTIILSILTGLVGVLLALVRYIWVQTQKTARYESKALNEKIDTLTNVVNGHGRVQISLEVSISNLNDNVTGLKDWLNKVQNGQEKIKECLSDVEKDIAVINYEGNKKSRTTRKKR